ncbi:hypothetical protein A3I35_01505 [Candidatus Falkowbacteria bacterium RIFCSPLOWO2_02_FULL_45_15]|uniref:Uncharacterized protein n=2 Tax=Candidatus Falkowiibacteriota TaxID=1752728 RepID=A0A1F5RZG8_9BACT|nr:MAG: hypothetical protein A3D54_02560 [Candidatus Falkowbacteria bacterium RIFCSPHIGHO2_02_FULL_45_15]OGF19984.1 MAG: hypothetical protein A3I35_01505 [Candidatus Falkowbacteria bacterium RIFCSPLOWO2_02_FULL_45_15]
MVEINPSYNPPVNNGGLVSPVKRLEHPSVSFRSPSKAVITATKEKAPPPNPTDETPNPIQRLQSVVPFQSPSGAVTAKTKIEVRDGPSVDHPSLGWHINIKA